MLTFQQKGLALLATVAMALICHSRAANTPAERPLGTFTLGTPRPAGCPSGFTCKTFTVICPGIAKNETGMIADQKPSGQIKGVVMFFSGSEGSKWWSEEGTGAPAFLQSLVNDGFELVQVRWARGWLVSPDGAQSGQELLASRPATVIKWVHDNMYVPLGLQPNVGKCGFCITGNSAGAAQITYAMSSYGMDKVVDVAIPTSGPPMAAISKGCLQEPGYAYAAGHARLIDLSYGFSDGGPCAAHDPSFTDTWIANSDETGGTKYNYPRTRIQIIVGGQDNTVSVNHAKDYFQVLVRAQQPMLMWELVPGMSHAIQASKDGLSALFTALTVTPAPVPSHQSEPQPRR